MPAVPIFKLEQWRHKEDVALDGTLKEREADAARIKLDRHEAHRRTQPAPLGST
ncbi:hypothetical protein GCM10011504_57880 [Siccirubricoccus deserti]|uniref:Uncharacterized protein n=1 Tax=Siccirubricoccus deserti TaxID=2013562 RepID=A0A9X0R5P9_9PROT|nr:hypothetical protein [Siccirubricoccus deserti]MBC4018862.1 hypothetical protein [Siccirubricoccus deserti]GGC72839.1 hypothetical protein GCM10011504_57880 [Siccirubricoccus deserti]